MDRLLSVLGSRADNRFYRRRGVHASPLRMQVHLKMVYAEILAYGTIPATCVVNCFDVYADSYLSE